MKTIDEKTENLKEERKGLREKCEEAQENVCSLLDVLRDLLEQKNGHSKNGSTNTP